MTYYLERQIATSRTNYLLLCIFLFVMCVASAFATGRFLENDGLTLVLLLVGVIVPVCIYNLKIRMFHLYQIKDGDVWLECRTPEIRDRVYAAAVASRTGSDPLLPPMPSP